MTLHLLISTLFPYTTLFRSCKTRVERIAVTGQVFPVFQAVDELRQFARSAGQVHREHHPRPLPSFLTGTRYPGHGVRSEEHTSELQSHSDLVCRLLLEKKKT